MKLHLLFATSLFIAATAALSGCGQSDDSEVRHRGAKIRLTDLQPLIAIQKKYKSAVLSCSVWLEVDGHISTFRKPDDTFKYQLARGLMFSQSPEFHLRLNRAGYSMDAVFKISDVKILEKMSLYKDAGLYQIMKNTPEIKLDVAMTERVPNGTVNPGFGGGNFSFDVLENYVTRGSTYGWKIGDSPRFERQFSCQLMTKAKSRYRGDFKISRNSDEPAPQ